MDAKDVLVKHQFVETGSLACINCGALQHVDGMGAEHIMAEHQLAALKEAGYAVVKLPEPFQIDITEIDMEPTGEPEWGGEPDHRARLVIRFQDATIRPGQLFGRDKLAAALLAADAAEVGQ
jgi:hypothetical protein